MKITQDHLESLIDDVSYQQVGQTTTLCFLTLKCGFIITGKSACLEVSNFDAEIGKRIAYNNAFNQLWELEGYYVKRSSKNA